MVQQKIKNAPPLESSSWMAAVVALLIVLITVPGYFLFIRPQLAVFRVANDQLVQNTALLNDLKEASKSSSAFSDQVKAQSQQPIQNLSANSSLPEVLNSLSQIAESNQVTFESLEQASTKDASDRRFKLRMTGGYREFVALLVSMQNTLPSVIVHQVQLKADGTNDKGTYLSIELDVGLSNAS